MVKVSKPGLILCICILCIEEKYNFSIKIVLQISSATGKIESIYCCGCQDIQERVECVEEQILFCFFAKSNLILFSSCQRYNQGWLLLYFVMRKIRLLYKLLKFLFICKIPYQLTVINIVHQF